ncbi:MAG TPA: acetyl-CoA C-acyltransferase [Actinobacteria bacterium]|nr:acetyl-CoA C-acyltransferase [Actinomycetota bacterium]HCK79229.1 acetyl-CoA C-acyltransferase [Actinomycetota bacterium]
MSRTSSSSVIVSAARTAIGRAVRGSLAHSRAEDLLAAAIGGAVQRADGIDVAAADDLIVGCWMQQGDQGANIARRTAVLLGADELPATTVNRACASSLQAIRMAHHAIAVGEARFVVAAGVESISHYPEPRKAGATPLADRHPAFAELVSREDSAGGERQSWRDPRLTGQLPDIHMAMGHTAEVVARLRGVTRADQDAFALTSQLRAAHAVSHGLFQHEIVGVPTGDGVVDTDDCLRPATTLSDLSRLAPAFLEGGTVTAGNCCPLSDGAAAVLVMDEQFARDNDLQPLARIVATGVSALSPEIMGLGPVEATRRALTLAGMTTTDLDLVEINEAFAAQVLPCIADLGLDADRVNVLGGAIALGHPFGMTGARLVTTLLTAMAHQDATTGLVTMCAAGGQGMSVILERL